MPLFFKMRQHQITGVSILFSMALLFAGSIFSMAAYAQTDKLDFIADIPLMPNTELDTLRSVSFDTASGRVLVLFVEIEAANEAIRSFYAQTLGALGWDSDDTGFVRRGEMLKLKPAPSAGDNIWKVTLSPRPQS